MSQRSWLSDFRVSIRFISLLFGLALVILSLFLIVSILESITGASTSQLVTFYELILFLSILAGGATLVHSVTRSIRIRVPSSMILRLPKFAERDGYRYGFLAALSLGLGATIGSPLFVLIPLNVVQYGFISVASLLIAAFISLIVARLYGRMYREWDAKGKDCVGGPAFTRNACGRSSLRYFISRFGLWIGNTALAAYSVIIFVNYSRFDLATTLQSLIGSGNMVEAISLSLIGLLVAWFCINAFFEKRYARAIATAQIGLTILLCAILLFESASLIQVGIRPLTSILSLNAGDPMTIAFALVANTAFLFLLFFGFQEIQAMSADLSPVSSIPGLSRFKRFRDMDRVHFAQQAMILSVILATIINVVFALAVYVAAPAAALSGSGVPAIYLAQSLFGPGNALLMGIAFVIASLTTFVPSFLSSARHLRALSTDGFFPKSVGKSAWLFSLIFMMVLSLFNADFLVRITDFGVLVALAMVSFSAVWARRSSSILSPHRLDVLPSLAGVGCLLVAAALYFIDPSVVLFGIIFIMIGYLLFDIFELGSYGSQMFLAVLYIVLFGVTGIIAKSTSVTISASTITSLRLMQNVLEAAIVMFTINILIGTRFYQHIGASLSNLAMETRAVAQSSFRRMRRLRRGSDLDNTIDRWIRLMEDSDKISSLDHDNFVMVRKYLEDKLSILRGRGGKPTGEIPPSGSQASK